MLKRNIEVDLTAPVNLAIILRGASGGTVVVTVTQGGAALPIAGASIRYVAETTTEINKTVGAGITITGANEFRIAFTRTDTSAQNTSQRVNHECKLTLPGGEPLPIFAGTLQITPSVFVTATV